MEPLTPEAIEQSRTKARSEQAARIAGMATEEERLVKSINDLRETEAEEKARVELDVQTYQEEGQKRKRAISEDVDLEIDKLNVLRAERAELMKPIEEVRAQADVYLADAVQKNEEADSRTTAMDEREKDLDARENSLNERTENVERREARNMDRDVAIGDAERNLVTDRTLFEEEKAAWFETQQAADDDMKRREEAVEGRERYVADREATFEQREFDYQEKDREIKSRYDVLARAEQTLENNHGTK